MRRLHLPIVILIAIGCTEAKHSDHKSGLPDQKEFHRHLDAQGGWRGIKWDADGLGVKVKHDSGGLPCQFVVRRSSDGVSVAVYGGDEPGLEPIWTKKDGFAKDVPKLPEWERQLENLTDQLLDAFNGASGS